MLDTKQVQAKIKDIVSSFKAYLELKKKDKAKITVPDKKRIKDLEIELELLLDPVNRSTFVYSYTDVSDFFGVSQKTIYNWVKLKNCPKMGPNQLDLKAVFTWFTESMVGNDNQDIEDSKLKYWTWKAEREKIGVEVTKKELMQKTEIHDQWAMRLALMKSTLLTFADRLPPLLVGKDREAIREIIKQETTDILANYAGDKK